MQPIHLQNDLGLDVALATISPSTTVKMPSLDLVMRVSLMFEAGPDAMNASLNKERMGRSIGWQSFDIGLFVDYRKLGEPSDLSIWQAEAPWPAR